jgi:capsular polysaccharide export protein
MLGSGVLDPPPPVIYGLGFSWRKRALVRQFFAGSEIRFVSRSAQIPDGAKVVVWASGPFGTRSDDAQAVARFEKLFAEDGFLRSVGLGADLVRPLSWVIDSCGIYYDASRPSDLEHMLQTKSFDAATLERATAMRQAIVASGLTKYNVGGNTWIRPKLTSGLQIVLVPGQVETDASIQYGAPVIKTNLELLRAARHAHPKDWLIYKPHPDVVAGLRMAGAQEDLAVQWCDEIVTDVSMATLLETVDVVHVLTSLAGFEALLRGKHVVCHGLPFYAGWGLTDDVVLAKNRSRKLNIDELVAGVLIEYPTYVSRVTGKHCAPEQALNELVAWKGVRGDAMPFWRKMLRKVINHP